MGGSSATFGAVLDSIPVPAPLLAPDKGAIAGRADLGGDVVLLGALRDISWPGSTTIPDVSGTAQTLPAPDRSMTPRSLS